MNKLQPSGPEMEHPLLLNRHVFFTTRRLFVFCRFENSSFCLRTTETNAEKETDERERKQIEQTH